MIQHEQKEQSIKDLQADLSKAAGVVFLDYTGLTVAEVEQLRRKVRAAELKYRVVKNTLMTRALAGTPAEGAAKFLKGTPTGVMMGFTDPVAMARIAVDFTKESKHIRVKGGILENKPITASETEALSKMPGRTELISQIIGMILGAGRRIAGQIVAPGGRLVGTVDKVAENAEKAEA